jgi:hypothetical protein
MAQRIRWMALGGALTLALATAGALAATRVGPGKTLGDFFFGPRFARAEIVLVQNKQVHDYRVDRGKLKSTPKGNNLELRELDGTVQVVPVSPNAQVTINGQPAPFSLITRAMWVITVREGENPAQQVIAQTARPAALR